MSVMVTFCPHTGEEVTTGIELDAHDFTRLPHVVVYSQCPRCGEQHAWRTNEARLVDVARESSEDNADEATDA